MPFCSACGAAVEGTTCAQCGHVSADFAAAPGAAAPLIVVERAAPAHAAPTVVYVPIRDPLAAELFPGAVLPTGEPPEPPSVGPVAIPLDEQKRFNVGAFFLGFVWACGNASVKQRWIGAAFLILGFFTLFILSLPYNVWLGLNGNRIAATTKPWPSIAKFRETQRNWALGSLGWIVAFPVYVLLLEVVGIGVVFAGLAATGRLDALSSPSPHPFR